jgi:hypothetical protein
MEVLLMQVGNDMATVVSHSGMQEHQFNIDRDPRLLAGAKGGQHH